MLFTTLEGSSRWARWCFKLYAPEGGLQLALRGGVPFPLHSHNGLVQFPVNLTHGRLFITLFVSVRPAPPGVVYQPKRPTASVRSRLDVGWVHFKFIIIVLILFIICFCLADCRRWLADLQITCQSSSSCVSVCRKAIVIVCCGRKIWTKRKRSMWN